MTSRVELRKQQQLIVTASTPSLGYLAGETVTEGRTVDSPGLLFTNNIARTEQLLLIDTGASVRGVSVGGDAVPLAMVDTLGFSLSPTTSRKIWYRFTRTGVSIADLSLGFPEFTSAVDISEALVTVQTQTRRGTTTSAAEQQPTWWDVIDNIARGPLSSEIVTRPDTAQARQDFRTMVIDYNSLGPDTAFGALVQRWGWRLHPTSTRRREAQPYDVDAVRAVSFSENGYLKMVLQAIKDNGYESALQISPWRPASSRTIPAPLYRLVANFGAAYSETVINLPNTPTVNTYTFQRGEATGSQSPATTRLRFRLVDSSNRAVAFSQTAFVESVLVPLPREFGNRTFQALKKVDNSVSNDPIPLFIFAHAAAIQIPTTATVTGDRPNERLTYSAGPWDGTFQTGRCRCPAWILYHVLTADRFGIRLPASRIDTQSFERASRYCQALVGSQPRWAFDGLLRGTQNSIVQDLLDSMRGFLAVSHDGRFRLVVEQPAAVDWIICPATVASGDIGYRNALSRPPVRANYLDRLNAQERVTDGLLNSRFQDVPFGDPQVVERWAAWQTFHDQNLLGTMECTLSWEASRVQIGDLLAVYDPVSSGTRAAGRIVNATATWMTLDRVPLELWPAEVAAAQLLHPNPRTAVDPATWGWVYTDLTGVSLRLQAPDGGIASVAIHRVAWLPGGRDNQNRVFLSAPQPVRAPHTPWALEVGFLHPTLWRVQSVSEEANGTQFRLTATRYLDGMHAHVETGAALPVRNYRWKPECGNKLSLFQGPFSELNQRYPKPGSAPFGDPGVFTDLTTSCPR